MRISDWSSDVCSSDLAQHLGNAAHAHAADADEVHARVAPGDVARSRHVAGIEHHADHALRTLVGSARWRRRLVPRAIAWVVVLGAGWAGTGPCTPGGLSGARVGCEVGGGGVCLVG